MAEAGRAYAFLEGRPTVGFEDVRAIAEPALNHRLVLNYKAKFDGVNAASIVRKLLKTIDETGIRLPKDLEIEAR